MFGAKRISFCINYGTERTEEKITQNLSPFLVQPELMKIIFITNKLENWQKK
jgi:hypothetical protein